MKINWASVYDGTIVPKKKEVNMFGTPEDTEEYAFIEKFEFTKAGTYGKDVMNKKFELPILPIPWSNDYKENVALTLEWLVRDHRKDDIRLDEDEILEHVREFWYRSTHFEGEYTHVCYPHNILQLRHQYDEAHAFLRNLSPSDMSTHVINIKKHLSQLLWAAWKCTGRDGTRNKETGKPLYIYKCSRCGNAMPKSIKAYVILTQSQLKECVEQ